MARQADHADIMCEVFPAKLSAKAEFLRPSAVLVPVADRGTPGREHYLQSVARVIVVCAGQLHRFEGAFR